MDILSARNLALLGLRRGAYNGPRRRRFVLFVDNYDGTETRHEYDTKRERDTAARAAVKRRERESAAEGLAQMRCEIGGG